MKEITPIIPFAKKACAEISVPGSKSITNRAMLLAAMLENPITIKNPLYSRDSRIMMDCLRQLGFEVSEGENEVKISGSPNKNAHLFVGNAGTAARFITAFVCTIKGGKFEFDSDEEMYARPMKGLIDALREQGAKFVFKKAENAFPFIVETNGLKGGKIKLDARQSSQILSAILMSSALAYTDTEIELLGDTVSRPFIEMTLKMMADFGFCPEKVSDSLFRVKHGFMGFSPNEYCVEPDATAASYPIMLASVAGGAVLVKDFPKDSIQGDAEFANLAQRCGFVKLDRVGNDLLVRCGDNSPEKCREDFNDISDTFLTLASSSCVLPCSTYISGISHTRKQETDRVSAVANEAQKLSKNISQGEDFIEIDAFKSLEDFRKNVKSPVEIETYKDHRIAMSFALCGCKDMFEDGKAWLNIIDAKCCSKTWPEFFNVLEKARMDSQKFKVVAIDGGAAVGKSSVSKESSKTLGYMHVDTGAHYRTLTYILLSNNITPDSSDDEILAMLKNLEISAVVKGNSALMAVSGKEIEDSLIRTDLVNQNVSVFAAKPFLREFLKGYQRSMKDFAKNAGFGGLVMEGRDIASVIFPEADVKIFLDADEETRAKRRAKEGISDSIAKRDALDKNRKTAPLVCTEGATRIDTSNMTKDEVVAKAISLIIKA